MLQLLGLKQEDLAALPARLQEAFQGLQAEMACIKENLAGIQRTLEYEFGRPRKDLQGHDPARMPLIAQVEVEGEVHRVDLVGLLGKPATRGHVVNIGDARARVWFAFGSQRVGPYILLPQAAVELSFVVDTIEVSDGGEGRVNVQLLMQ